MKIRKSEKISGYRFRAAKSINTFHISADTHLRYVNHKGKINIALVNVETGEYRTCDMINPGEALRLIGWLGKYLNRVRPTTATQNAVSISAHAKGIERDKNRLLAAAISSKEAP